MYISKIKVGNKVYDIKASAIASQSETGDGVFAVTTSGDLVSMYNIDTSSPSLYVGVAVIDSSKNISFFIDKTFKREGAASNTSSNYKPWCSSHYDRDLIGLPNGSDSYGSNFFGEMVQIEGGARILAFQLYESGHTGVANTNAIVTTIRDSAKDSAAKYCRSIVNPVTGEYDGYLGSLAEWIEVADNFYEINSILNAIGGTLLYYNNSGYSSSTSEYSAYWTSTEHDRNNAWVFSLRRGNASDGYVGNFPYFEYILKNSSGTYRQYHCVRTFFPLP